MHRVALEMSEPQVSMEMLVTPARQAPRDRRESWERKDTVDRRVQLDTKDCKEPRETGAHQELMDQLDQLEIW